MQFVRGEILLQWSPAAANLELVTLNPRVSVNPPPFFSLYCFLFSCYISFVSSYIFLPKGVQEMKLVKNININVPQMNRALSFKTKRLP